MRKITTLLVGFFLLVSAGKAIGMTPIPSCRGDRDCANGYRCVYLDGRSDSGAGYCAKTYTGVTVVPTKVELKLAQEGQFCGAGPSGVIKCATGLMCDESKGYITNSNGVTSTRVGSGGICRKIVTPTMSCNKLWWFDASSKVCSQKQFCGAYMYQGLQTYKTAEECKKNLPFANCAFKKCGDANCDGKIDSRDLMAWMRERAGVGKSADFNMDGKVDIKDYEVLKNGLLKGCGRITPTPILKPTLTPVISKIVNWNTQWASFSATNFQVQVADGTTKGRLFTVNPSKPCNMTTGEMVCVSSNPPNLRENGQHYMSLEVTWYENDIEMRMFIYLYSDGKKWWSNEIRVYNGQAVPNTEWVYFYGKFFETPVGESFKQTTQFSVTAADPKNNNTPVTLRFSNVNFEVFKNYFGKITPTPVRKCETDKDCVSGQRCFQPPMPVCKEGMVCSQVMPMKYCVGQVIPTTTTCKEGVNSFSVSNSCGNGTYKYASYTCYDGFSGKLGSATKCISSAQLVVQAQKMCVGHGNCPKVPTIVPVMSCNMSVNPPRNCPKGYECISTSNLVGADGKCVKGDLPRPSIAISISPTCNPNGDADGDGKITLRDYAIWKYEYGGAKTSKSDFNCDKQVNMDDYQIWKRNFLLSRSLVVTSNN